VIKLIKLGSECLESMVPDVSFDAHSGESAKKIFL
jgi:hypothetical protein